MNKMVDEALLEKVKSLISQRDRIDRELEAILGGATRRGRPRKDAAAAVANGADTTVGDDR
jgi:hypothetical protein